MKFSKKFKEALLLRLPNWLGFLAYGMLVSVSLLVAYTAYLLIKII